MEFDLSTTDYGGADAGSSQQWENKLCQSPPSSGTAIVSPDSRPTCTRGKSVRDFEEELQELKRENFDLKMRIYIMEEQQDLFQGIENIDQIYEINMSLKKEVETLKKEICEKDDLVLKAGDAMNMLANKHKEEIGILRMQAHEEVEQCRERMEKMQQELMDFRDKSVIYAQHSKLDESSVMFTLPYTLPGEKKELDLTSRRDQEIVARLANQITEMEMELKEKTRQLEEAMKTIDRLNREVTSLREMDNKLRSEIVSKVGQLTMLQNELAVRDIDIQALQKKLLSYEAKLSKNASRDQVAQEEQQLTDGLHKLQIEREQSNYQRMKNKYDLCRQENNQLSNQIVELHKRLNELQVDLQAKGAINMDLHQQLEAIKTSNADLQEEARMLKVMSECSDMDCPSGGNGGGGGGSGGSDAIKHTKKVTELTKQLQEVMQKLRDKERELKEAKSEQYSTIVVVQKLMKQNKSLTKDVENMKVLLEKKEQQQHSNVELGRGEQYKSKYEDVTKKMTEIEKERDMLRIVLEQQIQKLLDTLEEKESLIKEYQSDEAQSSDKEGRIEELEKQVASLRMEVGSTETVAEDSEKKKLYEELEEKKKEIEHLNEELRKRTFNLQELVNKELWDKNREIEKLNKVCEKKQTEVTNLKTQMQRQEEELSVLNGKLQELSDHITQNISKISERKEEPVSYREKYLSEVEEKNEINKEVESLKEKLGDEVKKNEELIKDCARWKEEVEQVDKSRKELFNACTLLMTRLEELATFLDSLLPLLGAKKRRMLQQVIDRSRETSRSLSISFFDQSTASLNTTSNISAVPILPDFSQVDFFSEDDSLDITLVQKDDVEDQNAEVVQIREQVENMVEKLKQARLSPEKKQEAKPATIWTLKPPQIIDKTLDPTKPVLSESIALEDITEGSLLESFESDVKEISRQSLSTITERKSSIRGGSVTGGGDKPQEKSAACSESEGWSEPDRSVSLARIGIREDMTVMRTSDESSDSLPRPCHPTSSKKRHEEIRRLNMKVKHLEKLNGSLIAELRLREKIVDTIHSASASEAQMDGLVTKTLLVEIKKQREKLQASLAHNEFIRNQLEGSLTSSVGEVEGKKNLVCQLREMSVELERSCSLCLELERRCISLESERATLKEAVDNLRSEAATLKANLKEKENEALEAQCSLLDLRNKYIMLESTASTSESRAEEATARAVLLESRIAEIDSTLKEAQDGWAKAAVAWEQEKQLLKEAHNKEVTDLRASATKMKSEFEKNSYEQRLSIERVHKKLEEILMKRSLADTEWKQRLDSLEKEKKKELDDEIEKRMDLERKLVVSYEKQSELRSRLEAEMSKTREIEASHKTLERWWRRRLEEAEGARAEREAELRRRLDAAALTTSEAVLDRTRLANDRLRLQAELRRRDDIAHEVKTELERRVIELEAANKELESKMSSIQHSQHICSDTELQFPTSPKSPPFLLNRQRSNPTSDYTSDPDHHGSNGNLWFPVCGRNNNNASPDLGIESDQGRLSSLDAVPSSSPKMTSHLGEIGKLELENSELRGQLQRTRKALEETFAQLNAANQRKRQVERDICHQLSKTHYILQKARTNLESSDHAAQL